MNLFERPAKEKFNFPGLMNRGAPPPTPEPVAAVMEKKPVKEKKPKISEEPKLPGRKSLKLGKAKD